MPAAVPGATSTVPFGFKVKAGFPETKVNVTLEGLTKTLFNESFVNTFNTFCAPFNPLIGPPASFVATIGEAVVTTVTVA